MTYTLTSGSSVIRDADGAVIPNDNKNMDWQAYQAWLAVPNTANPYMTTVPSLLASAPSSLDILSTRTPTLNGTYPIDPVAQQNVTAEALYIQVTTSQGAPRFTNGQMTRVWADISGAPHTFTTDQFINYAEAFAQYVDSVVVVAATITSTHGATVPAWPSQPIIIP